MATDKNIVTTSLVIQFEIEDGGDGEITASDLYLSAEIDSREDGLNNGDTSFQPGDSPAFLVFADPRLSLTFLTTSGSLQFVGGGDIPVDEFVTFGYSETASLEKLPTSGLSMSVVAGSAPGLARGEGTELTCTEKAIAVVHARYNAAYNAYRLVGVPTLLDGEASFPVVIVIIGRMA